MGGKPKRWKAESGNREKRRSCGGRRERGNVGVEIRRAPGKKMAPFRAPAINVDRVLSGEILEE
jgi:hypothetical protein